MAFASTLVSLQNLTKVAPFLKPGEILLFYQRLNPRVTSYNNRGRFWPFRKGYLFEALGVK